MRGFVRNFVYGGRGPSSAVIVQSPSGKLAIGTIFWLEVDSSVISAVEAQDFVDENTEHVFERLRDLEDDGYVPGWSTRPWTEQAMIADAIKEAGWE